MSRILNCLLVIIGMTCTISGLILMPRMPIAAGIAFVVGIPAFILGMVRDNQRAKQIKSAHQAQVARRVAELTRRPWAPNQSLVITGNNFNILVISILCMGCCLFAIYDLYISLSVDWIIVIAVIIIFPVTLFLAARSISLLGKPICTLSKYAITTPIYGKIEWQYIEKIYLQIVGNKFTRESGLLTLYLSDKIKILKNTHWTDRILALFRLGAIAHKKIEILLNQSNEAPQTIAETANFLRCQATKNTYRTNSIFLDKFDKTDKYISNLLEKRNTSKKIIEIIEESLEATNTYIEQHHISLDALDKIELIQRELISENIEEVTEDDLKEINSHKERFYSNLNFTNVEKEKLNREKYIYIILRIIFIIIYILFFTLFIGLFYVNFSLII